MVDFSPRGAESPDPAGRSSSADYAIIKWGDSSDHVVTVHGFMDDLKSCILIADALNKDACNETAGSNCQNPFSCQALNH